MMITIVGSTSRKRRRNTSSTILFVSIIVVGGLISFLFFRQILSSFYYDIGGGGGGLLTVVTTDDLHDSPTTRSRSSSITNTVSLKATKKENIKYVYYQHVRKAAGTVGGNLIKNTTTIGPQFYNEMRSFPAGCILDHPKALETLFFTILRDPAERYASEFRYMELHKDMKLLIRGNTEHKKYIYYDLMSNNNKSKYYGEFVNHVVSSWVNYSDICMTGNWWSKKCFYPNMYTRLFSGKQPCKVYDAPPDTTGFQIFKNWSGSDININVDVTEEDYLLALEVLKKFDLVLTTKKLGPKATERAINVGFNVSLQSNWNESQHETQDRFDILEYDGVREILENQLQYDIKLFQYFDNLQ